MTDKRVTALLGAGATLDIGGVDARLLTARLIERNELIGEIYSTLAKLDDAERVCRYGSVVHFNGLKDAMLNHWDDIINFLSE